jgi:hypothetical protein
MTKHVFATSLATTWAPKDPDKLCRCFAAHPPTEVWPQEVSKYLKKRGMDLHKDLDCAVVPRRFREPMYINDLSCRLNASVDEQQRLVLQRRLQRAKLEYLRLQAKGKVASDIKKGRVVQKRQLLHSISHVKDDRGVIHSARDKCADLVCENFSAKWSGSVERHEELMATLNASSGWELRMNEIFLAARSIKTSQHINRMGISGDALCYCMLVRPIWWVASFNAVLNNLDLLAMLRVRSRARKQE